MKPYSIEFRKKIIEIYEKESLSRRKLAQRFCVSTNFVQKLLKQYYATLEELCELLDEKLQIRVSRATMGRITQKLNYSVKKNSLRRRKRKRKGSETAS